MTLAAAVAGAAMLTGCTGDDEAPAPWPTLSPPTSSGTSTPDFTPTLAPTPPVKPKSAYPSTREGAQQFVRWYLKAYEYAKAQADPTPIQDVMMPGCVQCQSMIDRIEKRRAAGQRVVGERITVTGVAVAPGSTPEGTVVLASFDVPAARLVNASGKTVEVFGAAKNNVLEIRIAWDIVVGWRVVDGRFTEAGK